LGVDAGQQVFIRHRWSFDDAVRVAEALGEMGVFFFEDAYLISDRDAYCRLKALKRVPIAGGEMFNDPADFERYLDAGAFDVAQPDASVLPGPAAALRVCRAAEAHGVETIFHGWTGPIAQLQNIHVALACNSGDVVEYCPLHNPLLMDGLRPVWAFDRGRLAAPQGPGMGAAPIRDLAERYPFRGVSSFIA
jgi:L-alanine-DL-glutamate epimerase-like enolase superfamily enzyme